MSPRKGPIRVPDDEPVATSSAPPDEPEDVVLPAAAVIDAGVAKFLEMAALHWPARDGIGQPTGGFKLTSFDIRNDRQLRMTLGLTYMAMVDAAMQRIAAEAANGKE